MTFTPGKWFIGSEHEQTATDRDTDGTLYQYDMEGWPFFVGVKETRTGRTDRHIAISVQNKADAHLIAAAPELLRACEYALDQLADITTAEFERGGDKSIRDMLASAIKKATE